jgi:hypothetical protein
MTHSSPLVEALLGVSRGTGGRKLLISGVENRAATYRVGLRFRPLATLFEATLRCLLAGSYDRIVAFTGHSPEQLPADWQITGGLTVGDDAAIWLVKGHAAAPATTAPTIAALDRPWERPVPIRSQQAQRLLWRGANQPYWNRLEKLIQLRDEEIAKARTTQTRVAFVIDYNYLTPATADEWDLFSGTTIKLDQALSNQLTRRFAITTADLSPADLIVFAEDSGADELLRPDGRFLPELCARQLGELWTRNAPRLEAVMPRLRLGSDVERVAALRTTSPTRSMLEPPLPTHAQSTEAYAVLRTARLTARASRPEPPRHPERLALEFWANLDLAPLQTALEVEVIGQRHVKESILRMLTKYRERCRLLLGNDADTIKTANDRQSLLPVIGLFGAAGMGKTTFCRILARYLFGDEGFSRIVDLSSKILATETIGVSPPYQGSDQESGLMQFARDTGGLGVFCFDEFTRIQRHQETLAEALSPLLELVETRSFVPANARLRPADGRYHMTNTLFVFSANLSKPGEPTPVGFSSVDDLGDALKRRIFARGEIFYFDSLKPEEYRPALAHALRRQARLWALDLHPHRADVATAAEIESSLLDELETSLSMRLAVSGGQPSLGLVDGAVSNLSYERAFEAAALRQWDRLVLGPELLEASS